MPQMDNAHALVIGIANYENIPALPPTVLKDAKAIYDTLIDENACAYPIQNVQILMNEQATRRGIREAFERLAERANPDATVLVYLSSHGGQIPGGEYAGQYILPIDVNPRSAESFARSAISGAEFTEFLSAIAARKVLVFFDCCHSGAIGQISGTTEGGLKSGLTEDLYDRLKQGQGRAIIASSRGSEESWVLPGDENSLFTKHLLAGLRGGINSEDGLIRLFDIFEYLQPRVTADEPRQHPVFKAELEENFPVALFPAGKTASTQKTDDGYRYDVYINYAESTPEDGDWVWENLIPHLEQTGLRVAVSEDVEQAGVARVVSLERGITQARRTLLILSDDYFRDNMARFLETLMQTIGIEEAAWRVIPLQYKPISAQMSERLKMLTPVDLTKPRRRQSPLEWLTAQLSTPLQRGF